MGNKWVANHKRRLIGRIRMSTDGGLNALWTLLHAAVAKPRKQKHITNLKGPISTLEPTKDFIFPFPLTSIS